ncbi:hypothetical protein ACFQHV_06540 [Promicromonospora thailandica]|uniref:Uncharacterized protein n=1 Tax=Promicromonospora thailandica TaxID=765201 RepID=A0A9X2JWQ8_9MICO|nr:hypothetical protein [Promicromonospora thailandica]MCP2266401.1 hypothetical protein [Promicromonospora thailandica]
MNRNDTSTEGMSPAEYAELVREGRELVAAVERATRRTGAVFVVTMGLTIAATALGLPVVGEVAAVVAVIAFTAALVMLMARIALGPMPAEVGPAAPSGAVAVPQIGSGSPATGSGAATAENGVIPPK